MHSFCPIKGTAVDGFKIALINLDNQIAGRDARIVHILHDEVIVEARVDIAESVAVTVKNCMDKAFNDVFPGVPFVVEPEIRDSWDDEAVVFAANCEFLAVGSELV